MTASFTTKLATSNTNTGATTTASFSSTDGYKILVIYSVTKSSIGTTNWSSGLTCVDSLSNTFTLIGNSCYFNDDTNWDVGIGVFVLESNGSNRTLTLSPPSGVALYSSCYTVLEVSDLDGTAKGLVVQNTLSNGSLNLTLTEAPTTNDTTIFTRYWSVGGTAVTAPTVSMDTGWNSYVVEVNNLTSYQGSLALYSRDSSTSTSVSVLDTWTKTNALYGGTALALILPGIASTVSTLQDQKHL
jgi:hypothetical protein